MTSGTWSVPQPINTDSARSKQLEAGEEYDVNFERAVYLTGSGVYHTALALVCGFTFLACGLQNNLNAYILPSAQCDLSLTYNEMGLLNAVFLAGGITSGFMWGVLADMIGRRKVLLSGMFIDGALSLVTSFSQRFYVLLIFRFFSGFIIGGPSALVLTYMGEFFSERKRTRTICYVGILWTLSWVIMPGISWIIIPLKWSYSSDGFIFNSWRLLIALMALPNFLSVIMLSFYPESPRFLLSKGRQREAREVLASIYAVNTGNSPDRYVVKSLCCEEKILEDCCPDDETSTSAWQAISTVILQIQSLFMLPTVKTTALTCSLFFSNMFGYYGLGLWLPELFNRFEQHYSQFPDASVSVCELSSRNEQTAVGAAAKVCDSSAVDTTVFVNSLIIGCFGLSGNFISGMLSGRVHRRTMPVFFMVASGLCVLAIYFLRSSVQNLIVSALFQFCIGTANLVFNSIVVDMFPPSVSGMGVSLSVLSGRLGAMVSNLVFGHLFDISCATPILLVAAVNIGGGIISWLIPKHPYSEKRSFQQVKDSA